MENISNIKSRTKKLVLLAIFTATVVVLQMLGQFIRFGMFSVSLVLVPLVVGSAMCGPLAGAWLGGVFGVVVLFTDSAMFMQVNPVGTIITVMLKGICCGLAAGYVYQLVSRKSSFAGVLAAGIVCPVVNTGIFTVGCFLFFYDTCSQLAAQLGYANAANLIFLYFIGVNFIVELGVNLALSATIERIIKIGKRT